MKKLYALLAFTLLCSASSFAIDQVTLTTGELIEGKVLNDVPNRHVDVQLLNGEKRRYPKSQVLTVERDVPSNKDREMYATDRRIFFGPLAGGMISTSGGSVEFMWGAKLGFNASNLGGSMFAPTLAFKRIANSEGGLSASINFIDAQFLFRRVSNSGFYFGPQLGLAILSYDLSAASLGSGSATSFSAGAVIGYDIQFSDSFSIGPDIQYNHLFNGDSNLISFGLSALFHFE